MRTMTSEEMARMRVESGESMFDTCNILTWSAGTPDNYNTPISSFTPAAEDIACSYDPRSSSERRGSDLTKVMYDATVRLPLGIVVDEMDKIQIISRFGDELDEPIEYGLNGPPLIRPTYLLAFLLEVRH